MCLSLCDLSYVRKNSYSILMKLCTTIVWNPKSKIEFISGQNAITPSPILPQFSPPYQGRSQKFVLGV